MKMGNTRSPCPYDAAARHALQSAMMRHPTTLHYASRVLPSMSRDELAQLSQLALSNVDFRGVQACKSESNQWGARANRL
jgi:hypothetical protein